MSQTDVLERMALANGALDTRNAREFLATSRESLGDPVSSPPSLHPPRYVVAGTPGGEPPQGRIGFLIGGIEEVWKPVFGPMNLNGIAPIEGYLVSQRWMSSHCDCESKKNVVLADGQLVHPKCGRALENKNKTFAELRETILSLGIQVNEDAIYNSFYPGMPGNDLAHFNPAAMAATDYKSSDRDKMEVWRGSQEMRSRSDNPELKGKYVGVRTNDVDPYVNVKPLYKGESQVLRGGTEIRHGRREWRDKMKEQNLVSWDNGYQKHKDRLRDEAKAKRDAAMQEKVISTVRKIAEANSE
jgi:hypothetical protein